LRCAIRTSVCGAADTARHGFTPLWHERGGIATPFDMAEAALDRPKRRSAAWVVAPTRCTRGALPLGVSDISVSTDKITRDRESRSDRRPPAGLLFHIGAGALLVVVMVFIAFYVVVM
jgi:hypothetical protein